MLRKPFALLLALALCAALSACGHSMPVKQPGVSATGAQPHVSAAATPEPASSSPAATQSPGPREALDYFREIAFTSEYGGRTDEIRKWTQPVRVRVDGDPAEEDLAVLKRAMDGLNAVRGFPGITLTDTEPNLTVWFVKSGDMPGHFKHYVSGNWGFFEAHWDGTGITGTTVAIATDVTDQKARNHLVFEELLQSMGLMQDSNRYPDSIFFGKWTTTQQPTALDWELLNMLYEPEIRHGMTRGEAMEVLEKSSH